MAAQTVTLYTDSGLLETAELGEPFLRPRRLAECVAVTNDLAVRLGAVAVDEPFEREFEARLADSSTLAFRVAYSVLRHREDAEDVAQEALAKAHKSFRTLRDRDRFRAWLVRTTWRLALDRQRNDRRRQARDEIVEVPQGESAEQAVLARERGQHLWAAIDALPEKLRVVMVPSLLPSSRRAFASGLPRMPRLRIGGQFIWPCRFLPLPPSLRSAFF